MRRLVLILLVSSCGVLTKHEEKKTINDFDRVREKRDLYVSLISDPYELVARCDALTFVGLYDAATTSVDIYKHEYSYDHVKTYRTGQWNRDVELCYEKDLNGDGYNDSRSAISTEGVLGAMHAMLSRNDKDGMRRLVEYAEANDWVFGAGPREYTYLPGLKPLLKDIFDDKLTLKDHASDTLPFLESYKGNVLGDYLALKGRAYGYVRGAELELLDKLIDEAPLNPIYHALKHRFTDGDQQTAISILDEEEFFPSDKLPKAALEIFAWNDAPSAILYVWTVAILEGV